MTILAIDFAVIAIVAFCGWRGYKDGLIRGVFGVVALIISIFGANIVANAYAEEFTGMLKPFVSGIIETTLVDMEKDGIKYDPKEHEHEDASVDFGTAYTALRQLGLPEPAAVRIAELTVEDGISGYISDYISDKLCHALSFIAVFAIAFILLTIIFTVIGNLIGFVFNLPGLKLVDSIAGVAFGLAKGFLIVLTFATIIRYAGLLAQDTLEETSVLNYIVNNNPVADILGL